MFHHQQSAEQWSLTTSAVQPSSADWRQATPINPSGCLVYHYLPHLRWGGSDLLVRELLESRTRPTDSGSDTTAGDFVFLFHCSAFDSFSIFMFIYLCVLVRGRREDSFLDNTFQHPLVAPMCSCYVSILFPRVFSFIFKPVSRKKTKENQLEDEYFWSGSDCVFLLLTVHVCSIFCLLCCGLRLCRWQVCRGVVTFWEVFLTAVAENLFLLDA